MRKPDRSIASVLARRFRSRAVVELENIALRHQLHVLRRQRPGRLRLFAFDGMLWVLLYRLWPRCLEVMVLVKPATVVQWHRQGFRLFWSWRSRSGRPSVDREISRTSTWSSECRCDWELELKIKISGSKLERSIARNNDWAPNVRLTDR